MLTNI